MPIKWIKAEGCKEVPPRYHRHQSAAATALVSPNTGRVFFWVDVVQKYVLNIRKLAITESRMQLQQASPISSLSPKFTESPYRLARGMARPSAQFPPKRMLEKERKPFLQSPTRTAPTGLSNQLCSHSHAETLSEETRTFRTSSKQ